MKNQVGRLSKLTGNSSYLFGKKIQDENENGEREEEADIDYSGYGLNAAFSQVMQRHFYQHTLHEL
jgi:hypothetical protein